MSLADLPIGVFDSGVGGLTVLEALARRLPNEHLLYLGDTARVPYGTRSPRTVQRYAGRVAGHLYRRGIKALVVACNTASTHALSQLRAAGRAHGIDVVGVIEPGVQRALEVTETGHVAVIGTEGTIAGGAYDRLLRAQRPDIRIDAVACPLFVALAEEGWTDGDVARLTAERYLAPLRGGPDTLILGCTHYPLLAPVIADVLPGVRLIDSAEASADAVFEQLVAQGRHRAAGPGMHHFLVTDNLARFERVGTRFLSRPPKPVELIDIDDLDAHGWESDVEPLGSIHAGVSS